MARIHGSIYQDCDTLIKNLNNTLEKLNKKLLQVSSEMTSAQEEFKQGNITNLEQINKELHTLASDFTKISDQRDQLAMQIADLNSRFQKLDKFALDMNECN